MTMDYLNIYNNLIKLTRNKNLYINLDRNDEFSDRLIFLMFHFALFLKNYKSADIKKKSQELFDFFIRQIELSIREIGYGDVSVNKKMKEYVNLFYSILDKIETQNFEEKENLNIFFKNLLNIDKNMNFYANYYQKYDQYLLNNTLNHFTKDILNHNFLNMAVPKRKTTKSRAGMRRSHIKASSKNIIEDKKSGEYRLSHHLDLKTGFYKGRQVLDPKD